MAPRLRELDPATVGVRLRRRLRARDSRAAERPAADVGAAVEALVLYARQGLPVWHWRDRGSVADALARLLALLYGAPDVPGVKGFLTLDRDPHDEIGVTLLAALARLSIERGAPVAARELAALAGVTTISVRRRVESGELEAVDEIAEEILPDSACRWLRERGVPGFDPPG